MTNRKLINSIKLMLLFCINSYAINESAGDKIDNTGLLFSTRLEYNKYLDFYLFGFSDYLLQSSRFSNLKIVYGGYAIPLRLYHGNGYIYCMDQVLATLPLMIAAGSLLDVKYGLAVAYVTSGFTEMQLYQNEGKVFSFVESHMFNTSILYREKIYYSLSAGVKFDYHSLKSKFSDDWTWLEIGIGRSISIYNANTSPMLFYIQIGISGRYY